MDNDEIEEDYDKMNYDQIEAIRRANNEREATRRKAEVGMTPLGSDQYYKNASYILGAYTKPNEETREKLKWLRENGY